MNNRVRNRLRQIDRLRFAVKRYQGITIETNLEPYNRIVGEILNRDFSTFSDDQLKTVSAELRRKALDGHSLNLLLPEAFGLVRETVCRILNITPFDEQLITGIVLHQRNLAQMRTGEGKTLAAVFPVFLNALAGRGIHVLTANDYLAKRDAVWMGEIYRFLGLSVAWVQEQMDAAEKQRAYRADITYLTAKQAGFDFLSDSLMYDPESRVQRPFHMCIVDEADFIMIDEARVPLVIARETDRPGIDPETIDEVVRSLRRHQHFTVGRNNRNCFLTLEGQSKVQRLLGCGGIHEEDSIQVYAGVNVALHAHYLLLRDIDYIIKEGRIELIDEFTGRIAEKRRWPYGIQTALEVKEGLHIQEEGQVCGSITVQHFINQYPNIAAMTATAVSAADEFKTFYDLNTVIIPPHAPDRLEHLQDLVFTTHGAKVSAMLEEIEGAHRSGRPVLVGTRSVKESQEISELLENRRIPHEVLNAKNDEKEAVLVARAGMLEAVTISTNMAGRGTDIQLGGPNGMHREQIIDLGGLYVIGMNRHESVRIDNQLRGRAGRQGDPGSSRFFISLEDDLIQRYAVTEFIPREYLESRDSGPIQNQVVAREIRRAQRIIEDQHFQMRRTLRRYTALIELQRKKLQELRDDALVEGLLPEELLVRCDETIREIIGMYDEETASNLLIHLFVKSLDSFWSDHLAWADEVREGIHLRRLGKRDPILEFLNDATAAFDAGLKSAVSRTAERFAGVDFRNGGIEQLEQELSGSSGTWTYLINDNPFPSFKVSLFGMDTGTSALAAIQLVFLWPLYLLAGLKKATWFPWNRR
ncbi:MAG: hypothetical protein KAU17_03820 [Spirochaetales bacterium]|nr:hypothetical protein [Spirochaetales bacterium]